MSFQDAAVNLLATSSEAVTLFLIGAGFVGSSKTILQHYVLSRDDFNSEYTLIKENSIDKLAQEKLDLESDPSDINLLRTAYQQWHRKLILCTKEINRVDWKISLYNLYCQLCFWIAITGIFLCLGAFLAKKPSSDAVIAAIAIFLFLLDILLIILKNRAVLKLRKLQRWERV